MNHKLVLRLPAEISTISAMQMTQLYGRKQRGIKEPLDENERGEWKGWLKTQHSENKIMASGPIDGETMETVTDFILGGSIITAMVIAAMKLKDAYSLEEKLWTT